MNSVGQVTLAAITLCAFLTTIGAADAEFQRKLHTIDAQNINNSGTMVDVNRDGKLDIIAGQFWYEAPQWKRHFCS